MTKLSSYILDNRFGFLGLLLSLGSFAVNVFCGAFVAPDMLTGVVMGVVLAGLALSPIGAVLSLVGALWRPRLLAVIGIFFGLWGSTYTFSVAVLYFVYGFSFGGG
jgi:hypothetical protein